MTGIRGADLPEIMRLLWSDPGRAGGYLHGLLTEWLIMIFIGDVGREVSKLGDCRDALVESELTSQRLPAAFVRGLGLAAPDFVLHAFFDITRTYVERRRVGIEPKQAVIGLRCVGELWRLPA